MPDAPVRAALALIALSLVTACADASGVYEADADRSACNPSYAEFYTGAGNLPVRCTAQSSTFW